MSERPAQPPLPEPHPALKLLGLQAPYTAQQAELAFREAAKTAHPDHGGDPRAFVELQAAYEQALALLEERRQRNTPQPAPAIPLPRRRAARPDAGSRTLSFLYLGFRAAIVVALFTGLIAGALSLWHRRQYTSQRVDHRAASNLERLGGSVEWDGDNICRVSLHGLEITPARLEALRRFGMLERLDLSGSTFNDHDVIQILPLLSLREIDFSDTPVTDKGVSVLQSMEGLETLHLDNTRVSDAILRHLDQLPRLKSVSLRGADVTLDGIARARFPDRYQRGIVAGSDAAGRATSLADFLPERQWAEQELRSAVADHGLLTSDELSEASRIDLAVVYEQEALSNAVLKAAVELPPEFNAEPVRRRTSTLATLLSSEGSGSGGNLSSGAAPALAGGRSFSTGSRISKPVEKATGDKDLDAEEGKRPNALSSIFGRSTPATDARGNDDFEVGEPSDNWLMPKKETDSRLRPSFLRPEEPLAEAEPTERAEAPGLLPMAPRRGRSLGQAGTPLLDLPTNKRRDFYFGEIGGAPQPRSFQSMPGSPNSRSNPFAVPGGGRLNPFEPADSSSATGHLDALRRGNRKMSVPGNR